MESVPAGFQKWPKPDVYIWRQRNGKKGNVIIWDWKSPTERHQEEAEEEGKLHYNSTAEELKKNGWGKVEIIIQSVSSLGYVPKDTIKKFKRIGIKGKRAVKVVKEVHLETVKQSLAILEKRDRSFWAKVQEGTELAENRWRKKKGRQKKGRQKV